MEDKDQFILHNQYYGCWCPGYASSQGISSYGIDLVIPEHSRITNWRVFTTFQLSYDSSPLSRMHCSIRGFTALFSMAHLQFSVASHDGLLHGNTSWDNDIPDACDSWLTATRLFDVLMAASIWGPYPNNKSLHCGDMLWSLYIWYWILV